MLKKLALAAALMAASITTAVAEPVKLGLQPWLGYGPLWVAEQKGFFAKHGVEVELTTFNWDQDMTAALASGNLHVIAAATNGLITNFNQGVDQKGFLVMDLSFEADAVVAGAAIGTIPELKGKKVAFEAGTTSDLLINYALKENGLSLADIEHVPMGASEAGLALISGRVDAAVTYEPYVSTALAQDKSYKVIFTSAKKPGLISDMLTANSTWIKEHSKEVQGMIRAWDEAINFIRANPKEGGEIIAKAVGSPMAEFEPAFKGVRFYNVAENMDFLKGDFQATIQEIGEIMKATNPKEITKVPTADELLMLDDLKAVAAK
ncbi:ABC transporter substrate-binding protein [Taklimakanibacter albus]|uniref:ABC transporter substrate-binding protein n=1 Tax=Taklimakanibacter albus TaxID=2800327 RepID=A0ACC5R998_9HYPH|nr:ABC transporter substrate-binding protein [Aestuariivirga sp. YIM B02566]MBK1868973.1 ABC transporter substrate-binding protein [Aestuariivirga sp. YIM B02566]